MYTADMDYIDLTVRYTRKAINNSLTQKQGWGEYTKYEYEYEYFVYHEYEYEYCKNVWVRVPLLMNPVVWVWVRVWVLKLGTQVLQVWVPSTQAPTLLRSAVQFHRVSHIFHIARIFFSAYQILDSIYPGVSACYENGVIQLALSQNRECWWLYVVAPSHPHPQYWLTPGVS